MKHAFLWLLLVLFVGKAAAALTSTEWAAQSRAVSELRARTQALEKTDPEQALAAYQAFLEQHPDLAPVLGAGLLTTVVDLSYNRLKKVDVALNACDRMIGSYANDRALAGPLAEKARILIAENRPADAQAVLERNWDQVMAAYRDLVGPAVQQYVAALDAQGKQAAATAVVRRTLAGNAELLDEWTQGLPPGWMYERIIRDLLARDRFDEALSWAKLDFVTCNPVPAAVERVALLLKSAWRLKELSDRSANAFDEALRDPSKPNPLAGVPLPELDRRALALFAERSGSMVIDRAGIINALLALSRDREAFLRSRTWYEARPKGSDADLYSEPPRRVLKAVYLNLDAGEQFGRYRRLGKGTDPLEELAKKLVHDEESLKSRPTVSTPPGFTLAAWESDQKAVGDLLQRVGAQEKADPEQAVSAYRAFLQAHPDLNPMSAVNLVSAIVDFCYTRMKSPAVALQMCDWAIEKYGADGALKRYVVRTLADKARVLTAEGRPAEAEALLKGAWEQIAAGWGDTTPYAVQQYVAALDAQGKQEVASKAVLDVLRKNPDCLQEQWQSGHPQTGWMYERVVNDLVARGRCDEALRWAKLNWLTATADACQPGTGRATLLLQRVWKLKTLSDTTGRAFEEAIVDPSKPNPLASIGLPEIDAKAYADRVARPDAGEIDHEGHLNALITLGRLPEAIAQARDWYITDPGSVEHIGRLLKAGLLNVKVIDDLDLYRRTGQGTNPLDVLARKLAPDGGEGARGDAGK